jgi:hypothetical protein
MTPSARSGISPAIATAEKGTTMTDHGADRASAMTPMPGTRMLLACGIAAEPLFMLVAVIQAFTRHGFGITRHVVNLLSKRMPWLDPDH